MQMRMATYGDVDIACGIIRQARKRMHDLGIDQWQNGYPNRDSIVTDVATGVGRVMCESERIAAYGAVKFGADPTYGRIDGGAWLTAGDDYVVVHRLAVSDDSLHAGVATEFMRQVENEARRRGLASFRVDTHRDNAYMRSMLGKLGFTYCGVIYVSDGSPRLAYEKVLHR